MAAKSLQLHQFFSQLNLFSVSCKCNKIFWPNPWKCPRHCFVSVGVLVSLDQDEWCFNALSAAIQMTQVKVKCSLVLVNSHSAQAKCLQITAQCHSVLILIMSKSLCWIIFLQSLSEGCCLWIKNFHKIVFFSFSLISFLLYLPIYNQWCFASLDPNIT